MNLEDLPLFADELGPHGSATSDSERTMVTPETKNILAVFVSFGGPENLDRYAGRMKALLADHVAGTNLEFVIVR